MKNTNADHEKMKDLLRCASKISFSESPCCRRTIVSIVTLMAVKVEALHPHSTFAHYAIKAATQKICKKITKPCLKHFLMYTNDVKNGLVQKIEESTKFGTHSIKFI